MKLKRRKVKKGRVEIIPMIDTVVILLIFYMSFSRFVEQNKESSIKLPGTKAGVESTIRENQVTINMYSSDRLSISKQEYSIDELPGLLRGFRKKMIDADPKAEMQVILRGNKTMTYKDLSAFMRACAKAQVADITFATVDAK